MLALDAEGGDWRLTIGVLLIMGARRAADLWSFRTGTLKLEESRAANLALILS
jgi:hypothetical protein